MGWGGGGRSIVGVGSGCGDILDDRGSPVRNLDGHGIRVAAGNRARVFEIGRAVESQDTRGGIQIEFGCIRPAGDGVGQRVTVGIGRIEVEGQGPVLGSACTGWGGEDRSIVGVGHVYGDGIGDMGSPVLCV